MQTNAGFFEEKKLDQSHDIKLLWQLYPYVRPYRLMLFFSIVMAMVITLMDLSLPYITKIAIDRYIVPKTGIETPHFAPARYLTVDIAGKDVADIVRRYPEHFVVSGSSVVIAYNQLEKLAPRDLQTLRKQDISGIIPACRHLSGHHYPGFSSQFFPAGYHGIYRPENHARFSDEALYPYTGYAGKLF